MRCRHGKAQCDRHKNCFHDVSPDDFTRLPTKFHFTGAPVCNNAASAFHVWFFKSTKGGIFNSMIVSAWGSKPATCRETLPSPAVKYRSPSPCRPMKVGPTPETS